MENFCETVFDLSSGSDYLPENTLQNTKNEDLHAVEGETPSIVQGELLNVESGDCLNTKNEHSKNEDLHAVEGETAAIVQVELLNVESGDCDDPNTSNEHSENEDLHADESDDSDDFVGSKLNKLVKGKTSMSEYEMRRYQNIQEFKKLYKEQFGEEPGDNSQNKPTPSTSSGKVHRRPYLSKLRINIKPTRSSARINKNIVIHESNEEPMKKLKKLIKIKYGNDWPQNKAYPDLLDSSEEEDEDKPFFGFKCFYGFTDNYNNERKRKVPSDWTPRISVKRKIVTPEEISERDLSMIYYSSVGKTYDTVRGTTCHQCRQKTRDTKSICRNAVCSGVRGMFCGFCLKTRYGEDVAEALKNPKWICPPCRKICNCSICRTRKGKIPTGILAPIVKQKGFESVRHFLDSLKEENTIASSSSEEE